jgi:hypothetical protein
MMIELVLFSPKSNGAKDVILEQNTNEHFGLFGKTLIIH